MLSFTTKYVILSSEKCERRDLMKRRKDFLFIEKNDDIYTISMTPELQDDVGTVGFIEFLCEGAIKEEESIINLEASKTILEIASPLTGTIVERNEAAVNEPALLNSAKLEENWLIKLTDVDEQSFNQFEEA